MAERLRLVAKNQVRTATLIPSSEVGNMLAINLKKPNKNSVWRTASKVESLKLRWTTAVVLSALAFPFCNWSPTAQMRVRVTDETQVNNLVRFSETFDNATYWGVSSSAQVIAAPTIPSPSGSANVDKLQESAVTAEAHSVAQSSAAQFAVGEQLTFSFFAKAAERDYVSLKFDTASTAAPVVATVIFRLSTGLKSSETAGGWTFSQQDIGNGWRRIFATRTATAAGIIRPMICTASSSTSSTHAGVVGSGIYIWGAMLVRGGISSYYPNMTSSSTGTVRPTGYIDAWQSYQYDSDYIAACAAPGITPVDMTDVAGASAYAFGGGNAARAWFAPLAATGVSVDISDPENLQGYIEAAALVVGEYWSPARNPSWGAGVTPIDRSKNTVTEGGTLKSERKTKSKKLTMNLNNLEEADRAYFTDMTMRNGTTEPIFAVLHPESSDPKLEQHHTIFGKITTLSAVTMPFWNSSSAPLELEQI